MANSNNETQVQIDVSRTNITRFSLVPAVTAWDERIKALKLDPKHLAPHIAAQWGQAFTANGQIKSPVYSTPALPETDKVKAPGRAGLFGGFTNRTTQSDATPAPVKTPTKGM